MKHNLRAENGQKMLVQSIAHVCASKRMEPNLTKSALVTNLLRKMLDTPRIDPHSLTRLSLNMWWDGQPRLVHHFRRHEVKSAGIEIELLAVARQRGRADDHRVRLIRGVPMLPHVDRFRRPNEQTGRVRFWIDMENADLG